MRKIIFTLNKKTLVELASNVSSLLVRRVLPRIANGIRSLSPSISYLRLVLSQSNASSWRNYFIKHSFERPGSFLNDPGTANSKTNLSNDRSDGLFFFDHFRYWFRKLWNAIINIFNNYFNAIAASFIRISFVVNIEINHSATCGFIINRIRDIEFAFSNPNIIFKIFWFRFIQTEAKLLILIKWIYCRNLTEFSNSSWFDNIVDQSESKDQFENLTEFSMIEIGDGRNSSSHWFLISSAITDPLFKILSVKYLNESKKY